MLLVFTNWLVKPLIGLTITVAKDHKRASNPVLHARPQIASTARGTVRTTKTTLGVNGAMAGMKIIIDRNSELTPQYLKKV
ncbi:MAG: hypothetical protein ACI88G_001143 [Woeseiaceae bacterium]